MLFQMIIIGFINTIQISCLGQYGQYQDFIIGYKYPSSYNFDYMTDLMTEPVSSDYNMKDQNNVFSKTLLQIFDPTLGFSSRSQILIYNDISVSSTYGHMKGVLAFDPVTNEGFWLTHSVPNYPVTPITLAKENLDYPATGYKNAQDLFCISIDETNFLSIAEGLYYDRPGVHFVQFSDAYKQNYTYLSNIASSTYPYTSQSMSGYKSIYTKQNVELKFFYKNKKWGQDLWEDLIYPALNQPLLLNTWMQVGIQDTTSVQKICTLQVCTSACQEWKSTQDHSKIGVTKNAEWTCFSDINFDSSQSARGGGAVCIRDVNVAQEMLRRAKVLRNGEDC